MRIIVIANTNSTRQKTQVLGDHKIKVWVKSKPLDGKANKEIIQFLKKTIKKQTGANPKIDIIQGSASTTKVVETDCTWSQVTTAVKAAGQSS